MPRFKVVLIEHGYASTRYERTAIERAGGELIDADHLPLAEALKLCQDADGILFRRLLIPREMIQGFKRCKGIVRYGVGTDNVDVAAATEAGIIVGHAPGYCVDEVSSHAIGLLLACTRRIVATHHKMREGGWDLHRNDLIYRMKEKTLGLVGFGQIGQAVAAKLKGWGLTILASDPFVDPLVAEAHGVGLVGLDDLLQNADYLSLHCPLLPETRLLIGRRELAKIKSGCILVNTARGPVVDSKALIEALDQGKLAQAALDVFEEEPLSDTSPLRQHPKLIVTDHVAWYSEESQIELQETAGREIAKICSGELPGSFANPEVLQKLGRFKEWVPAENMKWQLKRLQLRQAQK